MEKKVGKVAYKLKLPLHIEAHPIFHVSLLKPYYQDEEEPITGEYKRAPISIATTHANRVQEIISHKVIPRRGNHLSYKKYLVKWKDLLDAEAT